MTFVLEAGEHRAVGRPRGRRFFTARRDARLRAALEAGATIEQLATQFELSPNGVYNALKREGVDLFVRPDAGQSQRQYRARNADIIEKYKNGASVGTLGEEYSVTRERICQILRPHNLTNIKAEQRRIARETVEAERENIVAEIKAKRESAAARAVEIVRAGGSRNDATRQTGVPSHVVLKACIDAGLPYLHGRWNRAADFEKRRTEILQMRAAGKTWEEIGTTYHHWATRHMPELFGTKRPNNRLNGRPRDAKPPKPAPVDLGAVWTPERVTAMCRMYFDGCSAQHIADVLGEGFTRNSVIGKTNRLRAAGQLKPPTE